MSQRINSRRRSKSLSGEALEVRILQSFVSFPGATESVEGIAGSWLGGEDSAHVSSALNRLINSGVVGKLGVGEAATFFALDPATTEQLLIKYERERYGA